jgi:hypothetical protein
VRDSETELPQQSNPEKRNKQTSYRNWVGDSVTERPPVLPSIWQQTNPEKGNRKPDTGTGVRDSDAELPQQSNPEKRNKQT